MICHSTTAMLTSSPSPTIRPGPHARNSSSSFRSKSHYDGVRTNKSQHTSNPATIVSRSQSSNPPIPTLLAAQKEPSVTRVKQEDHSASRIITFPDHVQQVRPRMVDASTQYSPPHGPLHSTPIKTTTTKIARPQLQGVSKSRTSSDAPAPPTSTEDTMSSPSEEAKDKHPGSTHSSTSSAKRNATDPPAQEEADGNADLDNHTQGSPKRPRKTEVVKIMPLRYEKCDTRDLVVLISSMLMELIRYNDAIPLRDGHLTRFHSRAPPGISVQDYLQRLTTHATLSPPILLSMVYYIDRLCALYPSFTISSLTVHRFLITSATVASKGLSDSFWTNKTYARVGGVSLKELALLELEFLARVEWRIVPRAEVLVDYYRSLVEREPHFQMETDSKSSKETIAPQRETEVG